MGHYLKGTWAGLLAALVVLVGLALCPQEARANAAVYQERASGAVYPVNETDVRLISERVVVYPLAKTSYSKLVFYNFSPVVSGFDCRFELRNTAKQPRSFLMGFPLELRTPHVGQEVLDFTVTVDGQPLTARPKRRAQRTNREGEMKSQVVFTWPMRIAAGAKAVVRIRYAQRWSIFKTAVFDHKFVRWIDYLIGPSRRWRGTIDRAEFVVRGFTASVRSLGGHAGKKAQLRIGLVRQPPPPRGLYWEVWSRPLHSAAKIDPVSGEARWVFTNWEPRANERLALMVRSLRKERSLALMDFLEETDEDCDRMGADSVESPKAWLDLLADKPSKKYRLDQVSVGKPIAQLKACAELPAGKQACTLALETLRQAILVRHGHMPQRPCWWASFNVPEPLVPTWKPMNQVEKDNLRRIEAAQAKVAKMGETAAEQPKPARARGEKPAKAKPKPAKTKPASPAPQKSGCGCAVTRQAAGGSGRANGGWLLLAVCWLLGRRRRAKGAGRS